MNIAKDQRLEQAARWLVRSQDKDFTPEDKKQMTAWLNEAPANREAFEEMCETWEHMGVLTPVLAPISIHPYKAKKYAGVKAILSRFKESKNRVAVAVAAMAVLVLLCLPVFRTYFFQQAETIHAYKTMIGEQKILTLSDGSILKMNVRSALSVRMSSLLRQVELNEGEIFFAVAVDPDRPFEVRIPNGLIRVLGTAFNVKSRSGRVAVDVERGRVLVKDAPKGTGDMRAGRVTLAAGQGVDIDPSGHLSRLRPSDMKQVLAWQNRQAVFKNTPLEQVLRELELYHDVRVKLACPELEAKGITGTFDMRDLDQTLEVIMAATSLQAERQADGTITLYK
ncbi:MAG: FecR domain-containing protein [Deltaproteobacteria bacterium]|nr:FecR domain-containing protein [Deltaproteobacteria bacterium]MBW1967679.1 FecR domain-containing protein [Deltaproteobacteria bacterium]MBW2098972.1 FecR domain-containing protein [Deltaproteobacteria bacterium]